MIVTEGNFLATMESRHHLTRLDIVHKSKEKQWAADHLCMQVVMFTDEASTKLAL